MDAEYVGVLARTNSVEEWSIGKMHRLARISERPILRSGNWKKWGRVPKSGDP